MWQQRGAESTRGSSTFGCNSALTWPFDEISSCKCVEINTTGCYISIVAKASQNRCSSVWQVKVLFISQFF